MSSVFERLRDALAAEYALEGELGGGGMGVIFLARDIALDRRVAIKNPSRRAARWAKSSGPSRRSARWW